MIPEFLQSTYARYKADTNTFATWLLETANECGYQPPDLAAAIPLVEEVKHKGKHIDSDANPLQYRATAKDLQEFAEVVANSAITIPKSVLTTARGAIKSRKSVTSWFRGRGESASNKRHAHFITVLEQICDSLEQKTNQPSKPDTKQPASTSEAENDDANGDRFLNRFAVLTVEEPPETTHTQPAPTKSKKIVKVDVVEDEPKEAEYSYLGQLGFKALCLFRDLDNMRNFISTTWSEYRDDKIDLMNAAVVTDSALRLAQDLVQEVEADWCTAPSGSSDNIQQIIYDSAALTRGISVAPSTEIGLPYNKNMADIAEWCYMPTKVLLEFFANFLQVNESHLPVFRQGSLGTYDPKADRERMSLGQKFNEDKTILLSILPEFCLIEAYKIEMLAVDAITQGFAELNRSKKVTMWLCFASQIFLDVHHIMRHKTLGAFGDLRMSGLRIQKTIDEYFQLSKTHPPPTFWPKKGDEEIRHIGSNVQTCIIQDRFQEIRACLKLDIPGYTPEKHVLFSHHAIHCGLFLFHLNMRMQVIGQQLVAQWYDVQRLAFLHNLVINFPTYTDLRWPDMDAFLKIHGESHIFVGSRPKNAIESLNRLVLATGISSPANLARDCRRKKFGRHGKSLRVIKSTTAVANLFLPQYVPESEEAPGITNIHRILHELAQESYLESSGKELAKPNPELIIARKWSNTHSIDPLQLLAFLKTKLFEEEPVILYNYFGMHKRCFELLRLIRDKEHHIFVQCFAPVYQPDECWIPNIVLLIHQIAEGTVRHAYEMGYEPRGVEIVSPIVPSVGEVMRKYLAKNGDVACKELRVFCKNKKPIHDDVPYDNGKSDQIIFTRYY